MPWEYIRAFDGGENAEVPGHEIGENQAVKMQNFDISSPGRAIKRNGFTDKNITGTPAAVFSIFEFNNIDNGEQVLLANDSPENGDSRDIMFSSVDGGDFKILNAWGHTANHIDGNKTPVTDRWTTSPNGAWTFIRANASAPHVEISTNQSDANFSRTSNFYSDWYCINIDQREARQVTAYVTSDNADDSRVFKLATEFSASMTTLEKFIFVKDSYDSGNTPIFDFEQFNGVVRGGVGSAITNSPFAVKHLSGISVLGATLSISDYVINRAFLPPPQLLSVDGQYPPY